MKLALVAALAAAAAGPPATTPLLAVSAGGTAATRELGTMRVDGTSLRLLTRNGFADEHPVWSPGGGRIAFARAGARRGGIYELRLPRTIVRLTRGAHDDAPAYAPDGRRLAFVRGNRILVLDGATARAVATASAPPRQLSWSSDGARILYGDGGGIRTVDVGTRAVSTLPVGGIFGNFRPIFSPDGSQIAFLSYRDERFYRDPDAWGIWVAAADGSGARRVATGKYGPMSWSADGRIVARFGYDLALFDVATGERTDLPVRGSWAAFRP